MDEETRLKLVLSPVSAFVAGLFDALLVVFLLAVVALVSVFCHFFA